MDSAMTALISGLENSLQDLSSQKLEVDVKYLALVKETGELRSINAQLEEGRILLNLDREKLAKVDEDLTKTKEELAKTKEELAKTKEELTKTKGALTTMTAQHASVVDSHSKKASKFTAATAENERLKNKVDKLEKERDDLQAKLDKGAAAASLAEIESLKAQVKARDEKLESTAKALGEQKDRSRDCKKQFDKAMEENGKSFSEKLAFEVFFSFRGSFRTLTLFSSGQADRRV